MNVTIRNETPDDYRAVEMLTRQSFWNVYKPCADEHYYVHMMRSHPDFIPELAFVLEKNGELIGNIMYTKAWLEDKKGARKEILSLGPLCVAPSYQRQKLGKPDEQLSLQKSLGIRFCDGVVRLEHQIENLADEPRTWALWGTNSLDGGRAKIPFPSGGLLCALPLRLLMGRYQPSRSQTAFQPRMPDCSARTHRRLLQAGSQSHRWHCRTAKQRTTPENRINFGSDCGICGPGL